ncbi:hypothetical protein P8C59_006335 [Phyllachora maydis]|uniref:WW domain-containing protein n=1 Tax=Phyllachora maydis TaxID=1825666 RepID=A0AAD9MCF2_9PEZI|nr:hypothetical protein P8C59_006335 [Phyllachora maydis]
MAGPASPSEGPTFAPPPLPPGWIAQWDGSSKKYYYVQLSTGVSQWETPTEAAPVGGTPAATLDHPYGVPGADRKPEVITHPDGSQTVKHPDGRLEPVLPPEDGARAGMNGAATGERGLGSFLSSVQHASSSPLGQMLGGLAHSGGGGGGGSSGIGGKLASQLASNLFSGGGNSKPRPPQNYHGGQTAQPAHTGGLAGSVIGGVSSFLGGNQHTSNQNFGYSNNPSQSAGYTSERLISGFAQSQQQQQPQQQQHPPSSYANHKQAQQSPYAPSQSQYSNSGSYHPPYANMTPPPSAASASQYSSQPSYGQQQGYGDPRY